MFHPECYYQLIPGYRVHGEYFAMSPTLIMKVFEYKLHSSLMAYLSHLQESISGQVITNIGLYILSSFSHLQESISGQVGVVLPHDSIHRPPAPYVRRKVVERPIEAPERSRRRRVTPVLVCSTAHNTQHTQHTQNAQHTPRTTAQQHDSTTA